MSIRFRPGSTSKPVHPSHLPATPCKIGKRSEAGDALALDAISQARAILGARLEHAAGTLQAAIGPGGSSSLLVAAK